MQWICVFCGARDGVRPAYRELALSLGRELAARDLGLVYGGARIGLMGAVAEGSLQAGGQVLGVIPEFLMTKEVAHDGLTELRIVESMDERKAVLAASSDAFIALPGGLGTMDELFEMLTWTQLGFHEKPMGILDVDGYYDPLVALLERLVDEGFVPPASLKALIRRSDPATMVTLLEDLMDTTTGLEGS